MALWFRTGVVVCGIITFLISSGVMLCALMMCVNPSNDRAMEDDPYFNGYLAYYCVLIFSELLMVISCCFGFVLAYRVWRNNHQLDHQLRRLFSLWLGSLFFSCIIVFIMAIFGMVRVKEPQEEMMTLYEIFSKYNQDVKFVGSFERYQRENSCCGINGPDDWMMSQFKQGGGMAGGSMGVMGGGFDSYMGSPSTGKCHLTPPTIPMGCGKKFLDEIHWKLTCYAVVLIAETMMGIATAALGWYCFFYWIEKEVIIIPEDEVSNLIVIEPESSTSEYSSVTDYNALLSRSGSSSRYSSSRLTSASQSKYSSLTGSRRLSGSHGPSGRYNSRISGSRARPSQNPYLDPDYSDSFYPNTSRPSSSRMTKVSNFSGAVTSYGGPHSAYLSMQMVDPNDVSSQGRSRNAPPARIPPSMSPAAPPRLRPPHSISEAVPSGSIRLHHGPHGRSVVYQGRSQYPQPHPARSRQNPVYPPPYGRESYGAAYDPRNYPGTFYSVPSTRGTVDSRGTAYGFGSWASESVHSMREIPTKLVKKKHSKNHMLHQQEKALGGKVLAEMHVDHSRDPDPMNPNLSASHSRKGHKPHHPTIAVVKNKNSPKHQQLFSGPAKGHGQTGHLATDILAMSGGAGAVRSLIDDVNLRAEHDPSLTDKPGGYLRKMRKHKPKGLEAHPDKQHPGHGPVQKTAKGVVAAPSADGSQAQVLIDNLFNASKKPPKKEDPRRVIKPHEVNGNPEEDPKGHHHDHHHHHHHDKHGHHHHHHPHDSHYNPSGHHSNHPTRRHDDPSVRSGPHHGHHNPSSHHHPQAHGHSAQHHGGHHSHPKTKVLYRNDHSID